MIFNHMLHPDAWMAGNAYGPMPSLVLGEKQIEDLLDRTQRYKSDLRKLEAHRRFQVWQGDYHSLIADKIEMVVHDPGQRAELRNWISTTNNVALDVTESVAVVWDAGAIRSVRDATPDQVETLNTLLTDAGLDAHASEWNRAAFLCGPVTVLPIFRHPTEDTQPGVNLTFDVLFPHHYEAIRNPANPAGPPLAVAYTVQSAHADTILVDAQAYRYYRTSNSEKPELVRTVEHHVGRFPGSTLRLGIPYGDGFFGKPKHGRLIEGTVLQGVIDSALGLVRKSQNKKLLKLFGAIAGMPKRQVQDAEIPVTAKVDNPEKIEFDAVDFDTDPANFIRHSQFVAHSLAASYGGSASVVEQSNGLLVKIDFSHETQTELRNKQIQYTRPFERDLVSVILRLAEFSAYPDKDRLPQVDQVERGYTVSYPPLARKYKDPDEARKAIDWELSKGFIDYGEAFRKYMMIPGMSAEEAEALVMAKIDRQMKVIEKLTKRNMSLSPATVTPGLNETVAEANGRQGGITRAANAAENQDE